ncbi:hypothetical protein AAG570_009152 [Ranatra chinensis]|uniref:Uncharacterized protein n=1 Tax=Ranatra chinensis TaxID=642074 RepID=A0ABD0YT27_9HEMI
MFADDSRPVEGVQDAKTQGSLEARDIATPLDYLVPPPIDAAPQPVAPAAAPVASPATTHHAAPQAHSGGVGVTTTNPGELQVARDFDAGELLVPPSDVAESESSYSTLKLPRADHPGRPEGEVVVGRSDKSSGPLPPHRLPQSLLPPEDPLPPHSALPLAQLHHPLDAAPAFSEWVPQHNFALGGPVYTFVKTDSLGHFKWGVRHRAVT